MALGPKEMEAAIIGNLKDKSGKDLDQWISWLRDQEVSGKKESEAALKAEGLGTFQAREPPRKPLPKAGATESRE